MKNNPPAIETYKKDKAVARVITRSLKFSSSNIISATYSFLRCIRLFATWIKGISSWFFIWAAHIQQVPGGNSRTEQPPLVSAVDYSVPLRSYSQKHLPNTLSPKQRRCTISMLKLLQFILTTMDQRAHESVHLRLYPREIFNVTFSRVKVLRQDAASRCFIFYLTSYTCVCLRQG